MRHMLPDDAADRAVDGRRAGSLDDMDRRGHPGERVECEQAIVEEGGAAAAIERTSLLRYRSR